MFLEKFTSQRSSYSLLSAITFESNIAQPLNQAKAIENRHLRNYSWHSIHCHSLKCLRLICSFNISLQHHKEDKHLGSKNTPFSHHLRRRKSYEGNWAQNPHSYYTVLRASSPVCLVYRLARYWNIDIHMVMLPFTNIITYKTNWGFDLAPRKLRSEALLAS